MLKHNLQRGRFDVKIFDRQQTPARISALLEGSRSAFHAIDHGDDAVDYEAKLLAAFDGQ